MRDEIWYREELIALRALVEAAIKGNARTDALAMASLGHLHHKLETAIAGAPSAKTPEGQS